MTEPSRRFFEDIEVGEEYESPGRTVTEADIVIFAGLSGDYNVLHTDAEFMKSSIFGERIAHGLLGLAIQAGLFTRAAQPYPTLPFLDIAWWVNQETLHHGGEIALLRDLYRAQPR